MIKDIKKIKNCPECGSDNIAYRESSDQIICKDCGLIYEPLTPKEEKNFEKSHNLK